MLDGCIWVTDISMATIGARCAAVAWGRPRVSAGASRCPLLRTISVAGCDCVTDRGILALMSRGGGEEALYQASYEGGDAARDPADGAASTISWLLDGVPARTVTVARPALAPSALQRICLSGCYHVGDVGIGYIATRCALLREIVVDGCPDVSDAGVLELARRCGQLRRVSVRGLYNTPSEAHAYFYSPERAVAARKRGKAKHESRKAKEDASFEVQLCVCVCVCVCMCVCEGVTPC